MPTFSMNQVKYKNIWPAQIIERQIIHFIQGNRQTHQTMPVETFFYYLFS
jgi:hypothetical protein